MSTPTQEYGWILIDTPEKKERFLPRLKDDEMWMVWEKHWEPFYGGQQKFHEEYTYRRKIDPGEWWEIVPLDDKISKTFEWTWDCINWTKACLANEDLTIRQSLQLKDEYANHGIIAFRRRKSVVKESLTTENGGWIRLTEKQPIDSDEVELCWQAEDSNYKGKWLCSNWHGWEVLGRAMKYRNAHWRYFSPPEIKDPADVAFEEALKTHLGYKPAPGTYGIETEHFKAGWNAGQEFERSKGQP